MRIILEGVLPEILFPAIERHATNNEQEYLADLYGTRDSKIIVISKVFPYGTMYANNSAVLVPDREEISDITYNLEIVTGLKRLGDIHSHVSGDDISMANQASSREEFIDDFLKGTHYSRSDRKGMKKKNIYLVIGFGNRPSNWFKDGEIIKCSDSMSVFGVLRDYVYCISGWYCKNKMFEKGEITIC